MRSKTDELGSRALNRFRAEGEEIYLVTRDRFLSGPYFYLELGTDSSLVHTTQQYIIVTKTEVYHLVFVLTYTHLHNQMIHTNIYL